MATPERRMSPNPIYAKFPPEKLCAELQEHLSEIMEGLLARLGWLARKDTGDEAYYLKYYGQKLWELCEFLKSYPQYESLRNEALALDQAILNAIQLAAKKPGQSQTKTEWELQEQAEQLQKKFNAPLSLPTKADEKPPVIAENHSSTAMVLTVTAPAKKPEPKISAKEKPTVESKKPPEPKPEGNSKLKALKTASSDLRMQRKRLEKNLASFKKEMKKARADKISKDLYRMKEQANLSVIGANFAKLQREIRMLEAMIPVNLEEANPIFEQIDKAKKLINKIQNPQGRMNINGLIWVNKSTSPTSYLTKDIGRRDFFTYCCEKAELQMQIAENPELLDLKNARNQTELMLQLFSLDNKDPNLINKLLIQINNVLNASKAISHSEMPPQENLFCENLVVMRSLLAGRQQSYVIPTFTPPKSEAEILEAATRFTTITDALCLPTKSVFQDEKNESHFQPTRRF